MPKKRADKRKYEDDDGRVIAPMNVHGMPWYLGDRIGTETCQGDGSPVSNSETGQKTCQGDGSPVSNYAEPVKLTRRESLALAFGMFKAMLLVILIGVGGLALFIIFCIHVWFR